MQYSYIPGIPVTRFRRSKQQCPNPTTFTVLHADIAVVLPEIAARWCCFVLLALLLRPTKYLVADS